MEVSHWFSQAGIFFPNRTEKLAFAPRRVKQFTPTRERLAEPALERRLCQKRVPRALALTMAFDMALALLGVGSAGMPEHTAELSRRARPDLSAVGCPPQNGVLPADVPPHHVTRHVDTLRRHHFRSRLLRCRYLRWPGFLPRRGNFSDQGRVGPKVLQVDFSLKLTRFQIEPELAEARAP